MNERIKELAEQVDKEFNSPYDRHKAIERFAELIVRDCVEQIIIRERTDGEWYQDDIFKHFGVKK